MTPSICWWVGPSSVCHGFLKGRKVTFPCPYRKTFFSESDIDEISSKTDGYSGADMFNLCREAAMGPIRSIAFSQMEMMQADQVRE